MSWIRACALLLFGRSGFGLEASPKAMRFWKLGFKFAFGRNKKGKVFGILSYVKKKSKSNDVHAQNITFLAVLTELLPLKMRVTEGGDVTFIH